MANKLSIAIMSDLHFIAADNEQKTSYVDLSRVRAEKQDPIADLYRFAEENALCADILMCPGDITVAACASGLTAAWAALQHTASVLGADHIFAATGNHDISSRTGETEPEIWERLKLLTPSYPSPGLNEMDRLRYWAEHFFVVRVGSVRILVLNTCNTHARGQKEYAHGRVTDYTIQRILEMTPSDPDVSLNVLLCHHHPFRYPDLDQSAPDYSEMAQGIKLIEELSRSEQPWLIIHGHKHFPRLTYAGGTSSSPTVFSAGSFSAILSPVYFQTAVNQFYILDLDIDDLSRLGGVGTVRSWEWIKSIGWSPSDFASNHPGKIVNGCGFGHRENIHALAGRIASLVQPGTAVSWTDIESRHPDMKYMLIEDRAKLMSMLMERHGIRAVGQNPLNPVQLLREA
ncbi:metallophosphoesterase [Dyella halodurans]|uniref:Metallophosphoesterase family protein n=1 Tax=Dyella halodurans TaxID=1920171 RepID=A0ABV9BWH5_9GAMM|nr:metallophosphoesterase [Dyella halodurans]